MTTTKPTHAEALSTQSATATDNPTNKMAEKTDIATAEKPTKPAKIKLTGRMLNFTRLHIMGNDIEQIKTQLDKKFANQPNSKLLIVLSCEEKLDLAELLNHLWALNLQPIGIVTGQLNEQANEQKLAIFPADGNRIDILTEDKKIKTTPPSAVITPEKIEPSQTVTENLAMETANTDTSTLTNPETATEKNNDISKNDTLHNEPLNSATTDTIEPAHTYISSLPHTSHLEGDLVYSTMLRSGQSINHVGGDLILTQGINAGAEAITDYSLHVYGKAEGRLVAGATGDENAKIFCLRFNPSLVSVAGTFCLRENIPSEVLEKSVQVSFERDKGLVFHVMNT